MTEVAKKTKMKMDPKLREMQERAETAQAQARALRKAAPDAILSNPMSRIEQKDLIDKYAKRDGFKGQDAPGGNHYAFMDRALIDQYPDQGYVPVVDMSAGGTMKQVTCKGDPLFSIPTDIYSDRLSENARRSTMLARREAEKQTEKAARSPISSEETFHTVKSDSDEAAAILREAGVS